MPIHDPAAVEIRFAEVHDAAFICGRGGEFEEGFLGVEGCVSPETLGAGGFCGGERGREGLDAGFAEGGEGGVCVGVVFEGGD